MLVVVDSLSVSNQQKNCKRCKGFHFIKIILKYIVGSHAGLRFADGMKGDEMLDQSITLKTTGGA
jgi:hypothetical protein